MISAANESNQELTLDKIEKMEYAGGGYFRMPGPVGRKIST